MKAEDLIGLEDRYGAHNYHPLACAIARASLRVIVEERLTERSAELSA